ncbi:MAG: phosphoribosylaminoimidazolesuccinocarboxamide synthase [Oscillospiraceae bacterium]|nr:phosphoribosylaminoimidazolesuccinocarboxamide synthase [Oscillospiraceae bacterium]
MEKIYAGKTKDVYLIDDSKCLLVFKDDVTGTDGVFDPGANTVGLSIEGIGRSNLMLSVYFFEKLKEQGVKTHYITSDIDAGSMTVKKAKMFGQGVEVICRNYAVGSFIRRYGQYIEEGTPLDSYVEFTLKDDDRGDPLITSEALAILGIMTKKQYDDITVMTKEITAIIATELMKKDLILYDIKFEFGFVDGEVILVDEIASGNMRVYMNGQIVGPMDISKIMLSD